MQVDVLQIEVPKDCLRAMPKEERALFFMLGYAANQFTMFQKLLVFSTADPVDDRSAVQTEERGLLARPLGRNS
jgi:hypothetical protein